MEKMTPAELTLVVGALDTQRFVNKTVYGCGCGSNHGAACPAAR